MLPFRFLLVLAGALSTTAERDDGLAYDYTVLCARNATGGSRNFCSATYPALRKLNASTCAENPEGYASLVNLYPEWDGCDPAEMPGGEEVKGRLVVLNNSDNCPLDTKLETMENLQAKGILFVTSTGRVPILHSNRTSGNLTLMAISENSLNKLKDMGDGLEANAFVPRRGFDPSLLVVFAMAVFSVAVGAFWSGHYRHRLYSKMNAKHAERPAAAAAVRTKGGDQPADEKSSPRDEEAVSIDLSPVTVIFLVLAMCGMLVLLYFFYPYLIYVILTVYCLAASFGLSVCLNTLFAWIKFCSCRIACCDLPWLKDPLTGQPVTLEVRKIALTAVSCTVTIVWVVYRHESWAWILQDLLGVAFSINLLRVIRLGSLKIISMLLGLLFFYDIFFVFVTPYLTKDGSSVMVQVATGGDSSGIGEGGKAREPLPMVLKVPHLAFNPLSVCGISNASLLGFGDILCPGLLVSYCHYFDIRHGIRFRLYYVVEVICYSLGMVATFVSLFLMEEAQPALLYLVPFTVIPAVLLSLARGEFKELWHGDEEKEDQLNSCNSSQNGDDSTLTSSDAEAGSDDDQKFEVRTDGTDGPVNPDAAKATAPAAVI